MAPASRTLALAYGRGTRFCIKNPALWSRRGHACGEAEVPKHRKETCFSWPRRGGAYKSCSHLGPYSKSCSFCLGGASFERAPLRAANMWRWRWHFSDSAPWSARKSGPGVLLASCSLRVVWEMAVEMAGSRVPHTWLPEIRVLDLSRTARLFFPHRSASALGNCIPQSRCLDVPKSASLSSNGVRIEELHCPE